MSRTSQNRDKFRRPEHFFAELLKKYAQGQFREIDENTRFLYRAIVVAIDVIGGKLENPSGSGKVEHVLKGKKFSVPANAGPENPQNSIKARIITDGYDQFLPDDNMRVFWPFFPEHISVPIKPGEYVYVVFEDENKEHGLWITKIPGHENINYYKGSDSFVASANSSLTSKFPATAAAANNNSQPLIKDEDAAETKPDAGRASLFEK